MDPFPRRAALKKTTSYSSERRVSSVPQSQDLAVLAPDIERFMSAYALDIKDVEEIMPRDCQWVSDTRGEHGR